MFQNVDRKVASSNPIKVMRGFVGFLVVVVCLFCVLLPSTAESALSPTGIFDRDNTAELHQCHGCDFESVPLA